jgi:glutathione S-transferase
VLEEKGVKYKSHIIDINKGEQYEESYMSLNPNGVVPTLVHRGKSITGSTTIIRYIDETFTPTTTAGAGAGSRRALIPQDAGEEKVMMEWIARADSIPMEVIIYGKRIQAGGPVGKMADALHHSRIELMTKKLETAPERLRGFYEKKLAYVRSVDDKVHDAPIVERLLVEHFEKGCLDPLESTLKGKEYLAGQSYTLADACWTMILQRIDSLGLGRRFWSDGKRPGIDGYLKRMMQRPSFEKAVVNFTPKTASNANMFPKTRRSLLRNPWFWGGLIAAAGAVGTYYYLREDH